jgi:hypothetical protein
MGSSGGGTGNPAFLSQGGAPIPGLPIRGANNQIDPTNYGQYQEFLPTAGDPQWTGQLQIPKAGQGRAPSAQGLTAEMFQYRSPNGTTAVTPTGGGTGVTGGTGTAGTGGSAGGASGGTGASNADIEAMKQQIAALQAGAGAIRQRSVAASGSPTDGPYPSDLWGY